MISEMLKVCIPSTNELKAMKKEKIKPQPTTEMAKVMFNLAKTIFETGSIPGNMKASAIVFLHGD